MRDCPECGFAVDGLVCPRCGAGNTTFLCCNVERGQQCAKLGTLSSSTTGGGPWYCADHFPPFKGRGSKREAPPMGFDALRRQARGKVPPLPKPVDFEAVAERLALQDEPESGPPA